MRILSILLLISFFASCYYENEESLFPNTNGSCDTTSVSYTNDIQPTLSSRCYGCHNNLNAAQFGNNIFLENYADVLLHVEDGKLDGSINHRNGYSPMPKGGGTLDSCTLMKFKAWIDNNAPNN